MSTNNINGQDATVDLQFDLGSLSKSAQEAEKIGLITKVVEANQLATTVENLAKTLVEQCSKQSLQSTKILIAKVQNLNTNDAMLLATKMNPTARIVLDNGPLEGLCFDWTHGPNFPIEIEFRFSEINAEDGINRQMTYEAVHFYQDGERLADGIPAKETQVYWIKDSKSQPGKSIQQAWEDASPADEDEGSAT